MLLLWIVNRDIGIYDTQPRVYTHVVNVSHLISSSSEQFMNFFLKIVYLFIFYNLHNKI